MAFQFSEVEEEKLFQPLSLSKTAHFTQGYSYGQWQQNLGRKVRRFVVEENKTLVATFQLFKFPFPAGKSYLYIPHGPVLRENFKAEKEFFASFKQKMKEIASEERAVFLRFDPFPPKDNLDFPKAPSYTYHGAYFQPRFEWVLDLSKSEDEILASMHPKTRYNTGLAQRKGVEVKIVTEALDSYFEEFWKLTTTTAERDRFGLHPKEYYEGIFKEAEKRRDTFLAVASFKGKPLVINLLVGFGESLYYVFGSSSNEERNLMPTFLAQWKAIVFAKEQGFRSYNFGGYTPEGDSIYRGWEGISRFKKNFGGRMLTFGESYDLLFSPLWYRLYSLRKRLQKSF